MSKLSPVAILYDSDSHPVKVTIDGVDYKLEVLTKVRDSEGTIINPATEDGNLATLAGVDFATETTLDAIKDTDGIKKITDALPAGDNNIGNVDLASSLPAGDNNIGNVDLASSIPAGTNNIGDVDLASSIPVGSNEIGKVAQGTKGEGSNAWPVAFYDSAGHAVGVVLDGVIYRFQTESKIVRASDGAQINPATQETLALIKDTDGIKKIVDPLAAGTNEIGKVAQGTRAAASAGWPVYAVDATGNAVGLVLDGSLYRFQVDAKVAKGTSDLVHLDVVDTSSGKGRLKTTLYTQDGDPVAFGSVPPNPDSINNSFVRNGSSESLLVNGSVTPVVFSYNANIDHDISIQEIKFVLVSNSVTFGSNYFGATAGPLTNGLLVEIIAGGNTGTVYNLLQNESFVNFASPGGFEWVVSSKDMMSSTYVIGGGLKLIHNTADKVRITVRDNLSSCGIYFKCFIKGNLLPVI